jgi:ribonuclease Z
VVRLADGAEILIHEAAGEGKGHSSARQAGEIAARAEVRKLLLIHYPTWDSAANDQVIQAQSEFQGEVALAADFMEIDMS